MMEELHCFSFTDANGVIIQLSATQGLEINQRDLLIEAESTTENLVHARKCRYIIVRNGVHEEIDENTGASVLKTTLDEGSFTVESRTFITRFSEWYNLDRRGKEWYSDNKVTTAAWVKQRMQAALLPFRISSRQIIDLYNLLHNACSTVSTVEPLSIVTASDLNKKVYAKPPFIVSGFLCAGLTLLAAPPKTGKSFLALDLACCIAEGKPFWGFQTSKGAVLYCDLEGTQWRTQERLPIVGRSSRTDCPELLSNVYNVAPVDAGLIEQLTTWIEAVENPKLIIIDTLAHVKGRVSRGEDAYSADTRFMKPLHDLAVSKGIAILAITHTRKANGFDLDDPFDAVIGSTAQYGNSDAGWIIGGKRNDNKKQFTAVGRDFEPVSFEIERSESGRWFCNGRTEDVQARSQLSNYHSDKVVNFIKAYLPTCGGRWECTAQEFINESAAFLGEYLETEARSMSVKLRELAPQLLKNDGIVVSLPAGSGRKGRIFTFELHNMAN